MISPLPRRTRPSRRVILRAATLALVVPLVGLAGCRDAPAGRAGGGDGVAAGLLDSRQSPGAGLPSSVPVAPSAGAGSAAAAPRSLDDLGWNEGDPDAPVRIVEFSDFGCGYCRQFHEETYPTLVEEYVETGKVQWKYVPMVLGIFGPNASAAAIAGECAGEQDAFAAMRDSLFATQREWKQIGNPYPVFERTVTTLGLDAEQWRQCIAEGRRERRVVDGSELARQVGVRGTPTFFIVGYQPIPGAIPLDIFREVLDTVFVHSQREGDGG